MAFLLLSFINLITTLIIIFGAIFITIYLTYLIKTKKELNMFKEGFLTLMPIFTIINAFIALLFSIFAGFEILTIFLIIINTMIISWIIIKERENG